jgi:hemolysin III
MQATGLNAQTISSMQRRRLPDGAASEIRSVFRRDPANHCPAALTPPCSGEIPWPYDRTEILADGIVHGAGIVLGLIGSVAILALAIKLKPIQFAPTLIYSAALLVMLAISAAYNMWPVSPTKWWLRRLDHSTIYLLIAGTYMPFLSLLKNGTVWTVLMAGIWSSALLGVVLKLALPGRFDRLSIALYLLMGWSGLVAYEYFIPVLPSLALWLLAAGGIFYSLGTMFHIWESLHFQNAIWHGFVLVAATCHYSAVLTCLAA